jgi:tRNA nucleotidyltransferase (CCA-adding enzyme)
MMIQSLPEDLKDFLAQIEDVGFSLCLIGGIPRDFLFMDTLGDDFDFEIRPKTVVTASDWKNYYKKLFDFLSSKKLKFEELPYLITRVDYKNYKLEFSSPRLEKQLEGNLTHHHFEAKLDPNLSYEESFKRRDLTINAIGMEFNFALGTDLLVDPFSGSDDLENGILKNITDDFFADNVRLLRLIRFQAKFDRFMIHEDLYNNLVRFDLSELSFHHFKSELEKSKKGEFLNSLSKIVNEKKIKTPDWLKLFLKYHYPVTVRSKEDLLFFFFEQSEAEANEFAKLMSFPDKKLKDLKSFLESYEFLSKCEPKDFVAVLKLPLESALMHPLIRQLKNFTDKKEWHAYAHNTALFLIDPAKVKIDSAELTSLAPELRSYLLTYKALHAHHNS